MSHLSQSTIVKAASADRSTYVRARAAGCVGHAIEWFDFAIYSSSAVFFGNQIFPASNQTSALLAAFGVYALGFIMRPAGGWLLGLLADKFGRRTTLMISVALMSLGSLVFALLPTYAAIGLASPVIATLARLMQGLSVGGEFSVACCFLAETSPPKRRAFHGSFLFVGTGIGLLSSSGINWALTHYLSHEQMLGYGWRIPFAVGALGSVFAYWLRSRVIESEVFERANRAPERDKGSIKTLFRLHSREFWLVTGATILPTFIFYMFLIYVPVYAIQKAGATPAAAFAASSINLLIFTLIQPLVGALSDKIGRKPLLIFSGVASTFFLYPVVASLDRSFLSVFAVEFFGIMVYVCYSSISAAFMAEMFSTEVRAIGIGLPFNLVVTVLGGTTPYLMTWALSRDHESWFLIYATVGSAVSLLTYLIMPETRARDLSAVARHP